jgi:hypothetical protein
MSDVGAVILTLGERMTGRALASLEAQTLPVAEVAMVEGVTPFHRALNSGADRVTTPFFVQVDADMVLDPGCVEALREAMHPRVGIAVGALRDPLAGTIAGVKMFRRSCFDVLRLRDTVAPDIDFYMALGRLGWLTQYVIGRPGQAMPSPTLGSHRPDYTIDYVFGTYYLLGRTYAHREDARALSWRFARLRRSAHSMAPAGRLSMAHGILGLETQDVSKPRPSAADSRFLSRLTTSSEEVRINSGRLRGMLHRDPESLVAAFRELGADLRTDSVARLRAWLRALGHRRDPRSLLAEVALGAGALGPRSHPDSAHTLPRIAEAWEGDAAAARVA